MQRLIKMKMIRLKLFLKKRLREAAAAAAAAVGGGGGGGGRSFGPTNCQKTLM